MADDVTYTEHLSDPGTRLRVGITWPRFAALVALLTIAYWAIL